MSHSRKCACGRRYRVQEWKTEVEKSKCMSCFVTSKMMYEFLSIEKDFARKLTEEDVSTIIRQVSNPKTIGIVE